MAIMVQEVTLRVVYDDSEMDGPPQTWGWDSSLTVGHANVGHAFQVTNIQGSAINPASSADAVEFVCR
jgi:hypothetical protein